MSPNDVHWARAMRSLLTAGDREELIQQFGSGSLSAKTKGKE